MLKGFFDESGIANKDRSCVVAGFAGRSDECDRVEVEWRMLVKPLGNFHACEFFPRTAEGKMTGIYKDLNVSEAEDHVAKLIDLLSGSKLEPIGMAIHTEAFKSLHEDERRWLTAPVSYDHTWPMQGVPNNPYFGPFQYCVTSANEYTPVGEKMHLTFDQQEQYESTGQRIYSDLVKLGGKWSARLSESIDFRSRFDAVLLQAADLLAYVVAQSTTKQKIRDEVAVYALEKLAYNKDYIRAMDTKSIDLHLCKCPFRSTFWKGMTEPDFFEQLRGQGMNVLACKGADDVYRTHHLRANKVRLISEIGSTGL
jgi:hypothetical protein